MIFMKEITVLPKIYDLILWITPKLDLFPKKYKFLIGDKILANLITIIELIIEAKYSREKISTLYKINVEIEKARYLIRLAKDLQCIAIKDYEYISLQINEAGKMIGGWIKNSKK